MHRAMRLCTRSTPEIAVLNDQISDDSAVAVVFDRNVRVVELAAPKLKRRKVQMSGVSHPLIVQREKQTLKMLRRGKNKF